MPCLTKMEEWNISLYACGWVYRLLSEWETLPFMCDGASNCNFAMSHTVPEESTTNGPPHVILRSQIQNLCLSFRMYL